MLMTHHRALRESVYVCMGGVGVESLQAHCPLSCTASQCRLSWTFPFERHLPSSLWEVFMEELEILHGEQVSCQAISLVVLRPLN